MAEDHTGGKSSEILSILSILSQLQGIIVSGPSCIVRRCIIVLPTPVHLCFFFFILGTWFAYLFYSSIHNFQGIGSVPVFLWAL